MNDMDLEELVKLLRSYNIPFATEAKMQATVAAILERAQVSFEREKILSRQSRIDFLVAGGIGIECKIDGSYSDVARQMIRYAGSPQINSLVLLSSRASNLMSTSKDPVESVMGKPLRCVWCGGSAL